MLRVRTIVDARSAANRQAVAEVQDILRAQFPGMTADEIDKLPEQLADPFKYRFVSKLFVAEDGRERIRAFALLLFATDIKFAYLESISTAPGATGGGLGTVLYDRVREEALAMGAAGLYFECLPDDAELCPDPAIRKQNAERLKFYERYGARPIVGTAYETPLKPGDVNSPYLVFDGLGKFSLPPAGTLKRVVRAILARKYGHVCPPGYIDKVVGSIRQGAVNLRPLRYVRREPAGDVKPQRALLDRIALVVNDKHDIHHVRERGYVEAPVRIASILSELEKSGLCIRVPPKRFPNRYIREVHDAGLVEYIERTCKDVSPKRSVYPYVFPIRNPNRKPKDRSVLAGYWCIDTFTPLNGNAFAAARAAVDCALTAAERVLEGAPLAYALVRPPGHHAERKAFGGFCYFNNSAIAAHFLSRFGRVAVLDIDYHHGNGTQDIFYERDDVLTVSIHGHPSFAYPYFTGFADERGRDAGAGFNLNLPLAEQATPEDHRKAVETALKRIARFRPDYLVLAAGFDTAKGDPTGTWTYRARNFYQLGQMLGAADVPTVVVQEGGYAVRTLGINARNFFAGMTEAILALPKTVSRRKRLPLEPPGALTWRHAVTRADVEAIKRLVAAAGRFTAAEIDLAAELVQERIAKGRASGYEFILAEREGTLQGYVCYGPAPATDHSFDLFWIVVRPECQGQGLGRTLLARAEAEIARRGGTAIYVDTSATEPYLPTRVFYEHAGFQTAATLPDFYRPGDGKVILRKALSGVTGPGY
ncbi:MAG: GNAT family N-acetyltransferase [Alphaproteobacteria bacterium]|nr:GNAT family N-acetyltransferase [Alphaproteobacteria bacterium]